MNADDLEQEARRWLRFAYEDLEAAESLLTSGNVVPRHVCWLAQQAAEKALKAALIFEGLDAPRIHDLDALRNLLPDRWAVKRDYPDLAELTEWAVEARYPGDWPEATERDARRAAGQSRDVCDSIRADLQSR